MSGYLARVLGYPERDIGEPLTVHRDRPVRGLPLTTADGNTFVVDPTEIVALGEHGATTTDLLLSSGHTVTVRATIAELTLALGWTGGLTPTRWQGDPR
jgi:hypothetical protein